MNRLAASLRSSLRITSSFSAARHYCGSRLLQANLPANLQLADVKVLDPEPAPIIPPVQYAFPLLDVPTSMTVKKFLNPSAPVEELTEVALERKIFEVAIRRDIVHNVIRYVRHKKRQPKKTKRMSEISGSNKKPYPQKGTGRPQVGHKRNSVWRGGQKAMGPVLRDYSIGMLRKTRALGTMISLAAKFREGNLIVVDSLTLPSAKTKDLAALLKAHGLADVSVLFIELDHSLDENFVRASNNLKDVLVVERRHSNVYEIVKKDVLVISKAAFEDIQRRLMYQYTYSAKRRTLSMQADILQECADLVELNRLEEGNQEQQAVA